jgi:hypothetical protein
MSKVSAEVTPISMSKVDEILSPILQGLGIYSARPYLLAMIALENANGKRIVRHNWGNIITSSESDPHFQLPNNARMFLAFPNHETGAKAFVNRLRSPTHNRILEAAALNDFNAFFNAIHNKHPETGMAYNYLTGATRAKARTAYSKLVRKYGGDFTSQSDSAAPLALLMLVIAIGGTYYASTHPQLRKWFR